MISKVLKNIRLSWLLFTVVVFSLLVKLGLWQQERALEKQVRLDRIEQLTHTSKLTLKQVNEEITRNGLRSANDLPVEMAVEFDPNWLFILDNQVNQGQLGYRVLQIVKEKTSAQAILVNLGWVKGSINREELPHITALSGAKIMKGHVRLVELGVQLQEQVFERFENMTRIQQIELDKLSVLTKQNLARFVIYLDKNEVIGYKKNWQPVVMPPEKHSAYAFQWFSLALAWLTLMTVRLINVSRVPLQNS